MRCYVLFPRLVNNESIKPIFGIGQIGADTMKSYQFFHSRDFAEAMAFLLITSETSRKTAPTTTVQVSRFSKGMDVIFLNGQALIAATVAASRDGISTEKVSEKVALQLGFIRKYQFGITSDN